MISGLITSVQGKVMSQKYVVLGKVRHSQCINKSPIPIWIISSKEGSVPSTHCLACKAGLCKTCSHVASVLFYVEAWIRIHGKLACPQVKCTWLPLTHVNEVPNAKVKDIDLKSVKK